LIEITPAAVPYLFDVPPRDACFPEISRHERLRYFLEHLEDQDAIVDADAWEEVNDTAFRELLPLRDAIPREKLRDWLQSAETKLDRIGLYGLLLGICGTPADAEILQPIIVVRHTVEYRKDIDLLMSGYLLLAGEPGLDVLDEFKLKDHTQFFSEIYAAQNAIRMMWEHGRHLIEPERLRESMRLLLDQPELMDLAVTDLARMEDWSIQDRVVEMYDDPKLKLPDATWERLRKRAIMRYLMLSAFFEPEYPDEPEPGHTRRARRHLAALTERDPKTAKDAARYFIPRKTSFRIPVAR
jgi:hypothetical protein